MRVSRTPFALAATSAALMLLTFAWRFQLLHTRTFDPDEFQHLHAAWSIHQGLLPYRDFFEHHMPVMQFGLAQLMGLMHITDTADSAIRFAFAARTVMSVLAGISVALTVALGAELGGGPVAWLSGALLSLSLVFVGRTLEIRPDVPALVCWLVCLLALTRAASGRARTMRRLEFAVAGLGLGCALVMNQKLLLAGPGLAAFALWYFAADSSRIGEKFTDFVVMAAATLVPVLLLAGYFWSQNASGDLLQGALLNNLGWPHEVTASATLNWMLLRDPLVSGLAVAGLVSAALELLLTPRSMHLAPALLATASLLVGLAVTPAPYPQYMLLMLPVGAVLGSRFVWFLATGTGRIAALSLMIAAAAGIAVAIAGLAIARPFFVNPLVYPAFGVLMIVALAVSARQQAAGLFAALVLVACSAYSLQQLRWMQGLSNDDALSEMRLIGTTTTSRDTVLDGFTGVGWFRPSAARYPFLHPGIRARLTPAEVSGIVGLVESCATRPRLVILDNHLRAVSPLLAEDVPHYYVPSADASIWVRKDPCVS